MVYNIGIIYQNIIYTIGDTMGNNREDTEVDESYKLSLTDISREIKWLDKKLYLTSQKANAKTRIVKRNEIYWCDYGVGVGSEMDKCRPSVIIQVDSYNSSSGNTIVAPITHDNPSYSCMMPIKTRYQENGEVLLDGAINVSNLMCVCKSRLGDRIDELYDEEIKDLNNILYQHLSIDAYVKVLEKRIEGKDKYIEQLKEKRKKEVDFVERLKTLCGAKNKKQIIEFIENLLQTEDNCDRIKLIQ